MKNARDLTFDSIKQAASWTGIPAALFLNAKKSGCPAFINTRVQLQPFLHWLFSEQRDAGKLPVGFSSWNDLLNSIKCDRERLRLERDKGRMLPYDEVRGQVVDAVGFFWSQMDRAERELPPLCDGRPALEILQEIRAFMTDLRASARAKFDNVGATQDKPNDAK